MTNDINEYIRKMGIEIMHTQSQFIFDKVNEARVQMGIDVYVHQNELLYLIYETHSTGIP